MRLSGKCVLPLSLNAPLLFSSIFKNKTAYHFAIRESSCDPNIKRTWMRQLDDCYRFSLDSLSEVTVSDLEMCHLGVVGYSIHSPLCARNRGTHSWQCVQEKSGWQGSIHNLQQVEGSESNAEDREAEDKTPCSCSLTQPCVCKTCRRAVMLSFIWMYSVHAGRCL